LSCTCISPFISFVTLEVWKMCAIFEWMRTIWQHHVLRWALQRWGTGVELSVEFCWLRVYSISDNDLDWKINGSWDCSKVVFIEGLLSARIITNERTLMSVLVEVVSNQLGKSVCYKDTERRSDRQMLDCGWVISETRYANGQARWVQQCL
jgi:hypothetical protein